jgi:hypothetical protein
MGDLTRRVERLEQIRTEDDNLLRNARKLFTEKLFYIERSHQGRKKKPNPAALRIVAERHLSGKARDTLLRIAHEIEMGVLDESE